MNVKCEIKKGVRKNGYTKAIAIRVAKKLTKINGVPMGWYKCRLGNHYHICNGKTNSRGKYKYDESNY